jgi:glycosyltransferase involved in cell wall biosynthesis
MRPELCNRSIQVADRTEEEGAVRIAQVSPLFESVPPRLYGGTERVVSYLTEELVRQGHDVTLFASGDSLTSARLSPGSSQALRLAGVAAADVQTHTAMLKQVYAQRANFDVIHLHVDDWQLLEPRLLRTPHVTTVHGRIDVPARRSIYASEPELALVSISNSQRAPLPQARWLATVYHGLPDALYQPCDEQGDYLAFVGRISAEKRVDRAIEIAGRFGMRLRVAAKVDNGDFPYYQSVKHLLEQPWVDFIGEVGEADKCKLLGGAYAFLFPIDWPEPFGLAMIEAMACGAPVIAWRHGSIPEVVDDGRTGFVVDSIEGALSALNRCAHFDRQGCAAHARARFGASRMARDYVEVYERRRAERPRTRRSSEITARMRMEHHAAEPGE